MLNTIVYSVIQDKRTALHWAASEGHTDCVALLMTEENVNMQEDVSLSNIVEHC